MAENGYGPAVPGHVGRIPNYGKTHVNPMGNYEPPACIQNAMMTKDKKPFTYTPGGLDLSQIRTPSMARRMNRQRSLEEHEQAHANHHPNGAPYHPQGGSIPPPPPPMQIPAPPPPPPLVISVPKAKSPKPILGERPEIVIPENPIGMLRKTNSPYHWESEKADMERLGAVPKFVEKVPSPLTVKMPPSNFSPQTFNRPNNTQYDQTPQSPLHRPEAQYANHTSPVGSPQTKDILQRQDSQYNKSPAPYSSSPVSNHSPFSPTPNSSWKQPERRDSPLKNVQPSPQSPQLPNRSPFSPVQQFSPNNQTSNNSSPIYHTLPRASSKPQESPVNVSNNIMYNNTNQARSQSPHVDPPNPTPWRTHQAAKPREPENVQNIYHNSQPVNQQPTYTPPWKVQNQTNQSEQNYTPPWKQENKVNQTNNQSQPTWVSQEANNRVRETISPPWRAHENKPQVPQQTKPTQPPEQPRYQSTMSIPVTPRKPKPEQEYKQPSPQREIVYVNQEPVYFCPGSPQTIPPWVKSQKEKTKTPPPEWVQKPLERRSAPRELVTPPRDTNNEPEWVKKSNEMQRNIREVVSPPKYQQPQPTWSTKPSDNRKSLPKDQPTPNGKVIPIHIESSTSNGTPNPHLRITIGVPEHPNPQGPYSQPTQRIMRVLSPQLVKLDDVPPQHDLPSLNRTFQNSQEAPKTRIIPIKIEGGSSSGPNQSYGARY